MIADDLALLFAFTLGVIFGGVLAVVIAYIWAKEVKRWTRTL